MVVYVNYASKKELTAIPNVGLVSAEKIIQEREKRPFCDIFDLAERIDRLSGWNLFWHIPVVFKFGRPSGEWNIGHIDINKASKKRLLLIPNVGPVTAERILQEREKRPFRDASDIADRIERLNYCQVVDLNLDFTSGQSQDQSKSMALDVNQAAVPELMVQLDIDRGTAEELLRERKCRPFVDPSDIADRVEEIEYMKLWDLDLVFIFNSYQG